MGSEMAAPFSARSLADWLALGDKILAKIGTKSPPLGDLMAAAGLSARAILIALVGLLLLLLLPGLVDRYLRRFQRLETNFRGETILQSYGLLILLWASGLFLLAWAAVPERSEWRLWLLCVIGFGALGFVDDTWGDRRIKGLRGHFRAALVERRITTGFVKAVGGAALALWLGANLVPYAPGDALLAAALIALSANAVNLLDLRPGRACGAFAFLAVTLLTTEFLTGRTAAVPLLFVLTPALFVWARDAQAKVMLGDTGSNLLGGSLGLALAGPELPLLLRVAGLAALIALHVAAERVSLTRVIEQTALLRALDRLTGGR